MRTITRLPQPKNQTDTTLTHEIWVDVKGYEGFYSVSNKSRIKSNERHVRRVNFSGRVTTFHVNAKAMVPSLALNGYLVVNLSLNGITSTHLLHRLLAEVFIENPENKPQVNHINGNRSDCALSNLEWVTASENARHSFDVLNRKGPWVGKYGENMPNSKTVIAVHPNGKVEKITGISQFARLHSLSNGNIGSVLHGRRKHTKGFTFYKETEAISIYEITNK